MTKVRTDCIDCMFAKFTEGVQTGCEVGRLDKFPDKKLVENEAYIINGFCNMCRHTKYSDRYTDPQKEVREEIRTTVDLIWPIIDISRDNLLLLTSYVNWMNPTCVKLIVDPNEPYWIVQEEFGKHCSVPFNVVQIFEPMIEAEKIDHVVRYCKSQYYMVSNRKFIDIKNESYVDLLDKTINDDLQQVLAVKPVNGNCMVINRKMYSKLDGNVDEPILDKLEKLAEKQGRPDWIKTWDKMSRT